MQDWFEVPSTEVKALLDNQDFNTLPIFKSNAASIEDFADMWNLSILIHPAALSINNLPEAHKAQVLENFVKIKQSKFYSKDPTFKTRVDSAITAVNTVGDPTALSQYIAEIDQRRNLDHQQYLKIKLT